MSPLTDTGERRTQRSFENFKNRDRENAAEMIEAFAVLKKQQHWHNFDLGLLDEKRARAISEVCDENTRRQAGRAFPAGCVADWQRHTEQHERETK
jgi:fumarate hydratase class II